MDDAHLVDWYEVAEAVANGRVTGHRCPACRDGELEATQDGINVRLRCAACGMGFEGRLAHGRDDALYAEADALLNERAAAKRAAAAPAEAPAPASVDAAPAVEASDAPAASVTRTDPAPRADARAAEPWQWQLPPRGGDDVEALAVWMGVVEAVHNGRQTGLRCPFCSEPLTDITSRPPFLRVVCGVCGESFEGRLG
ncbi:MAG: hypothetical protein H6704_01415 [Myxococcales bacterium]|nr:hypothetical protein [Myxococcales bacterium]